MGTYQDLDVWKLGMELAEDVYLLTKKFPNDEKFGLISQLKRAVVSIPSNISEGAGRRHIKENLHFLRIALGSLNEVNTQLLLANRLKFCDTQEEIEKINKLRAKLLNFIKYFENQT